MSQPEQEQAWTKEPWAVGEHTLLVYGADKQVVCKPSTQSGNPAQTPARHDADMVRICRCVNFLTGIPSEQLTGPLLEERAAARELVEAGRQLASESHGAQALFANIADGHPLTISECLGKAERLGVAFGKYQDALARYRAAVGEPQ